MPYDSLSALKSPPGPPFWARFVDDDDGRYADLNGIVYPVLLSSCRRKRWYAEDVSDPEDFSDDWCRRFRQELTSRGAAILVSDADEYQWTFLGLYQVHEVQLSNFLTCTMGPKLTRLHVFPGS